MLKQGFKKLQDVIDAYQNVEDKGEMIVFANEGTKGRTFYMSEKKIFLRQYENIRRKHIYEVIMRQDLMKLIHIINLSCYLFSPHVFSFIGCS